MLPGSHIQNQKFGVSVVNTVDGILASNIEKKISKLFGSKEKDVTKDKIELSRFNHQ